MHRYLAILILCVGSASKPSVQKFAYAEDKVHGIGGFVVPLGTEWSGDVTSLKEDLHIVKTPDFKRTDGAKLSILRVLNASNDYRQEKELFYNTVRSEDPHFVQERSLSGRTVKIASLPHNTPKGFRYSMTIFDNQKDTCEIFVEIPREPTAGEVDEFLDIFKSITPYR